MSTYETVQTMIFLFTVIGVLITSLLILFIILTCYLILSEEKKKGCIQENKRKEELIDFVPNIVHYPNIEYFTDNELKLVNLIREQEEIKVRKIIRTIGGNLDKICFLYHALETENLNIIKYILIETNIGKDLYTFDLLFDRIFKLQNIEIIKLFLEEKRFELDSDLLNKAIKYASNEDGLEIITLLLEDKRINPKNVEFQIRNKDPKEYRNKIIKLINEHPYMIANPWLRM